MKQIIAIFLFTVLNLMPAVVSADTLRLAVQKIESEWANIHYNVAKEQQEAAYQLLLAEVKDLNKQYPDQAELIIQQAIIVASNADNIDAFSALEAINQARELLLLAIQLDPNASEGAAFVTLGSLYYMVPGWPIAFGDNDKANALLKKALAINPNTIDANFYYGDFLATLGKRQQALTYFKRAVAIPVRKNQVFADTQLLKQAELAVLENSQVIAAK
ncbi:tetratricopeptide repeat protein [Methyloprofundus sp.]|uniref:tetratricopeptide repeat protein n=1 Tax=Methyloprofundus sp. TaxID=2020875 RepID=UPI003D0D5BEC